MTDNPMTDREILATRIALGIFAFFTVFGIYLLYHPSDLLTAIFAVLLLVTLGTGVILGMFTVFNS
jgi:hypothetical protein